MSFLNKIFWHLNICPSCHGKTDDWMNLQTCMSSECGYKEISRPKKYKYRLRYKDKYIFDFNDLRRTRDDATYKYYWLARLNLILNKFMDTGIFDRKYWISKEEIGRKRNKKQ